MTGSAGEAADWAAWLDKFERDIFPVFQRRGYSKEVAATIYFSRIPDGVMLVDEDDDEEEG